MGHPRPLFDLFYPLQSFLQFQLLKTSCQSLDMSASFRGLLLPGLTQQREGVQGRYAPLPPGSTGLEWLQWHRTGQTVDAMPLMLILVHRSWFELRCWRRKATVGWKSRSEKSKSGEVAWEEKLLRKFRNLKKRNIYRELVPTGFDPAAVREVKNVQECQGGKGGSHLGAA